MSYSLWVTLVCFFTKKSHQSPQWWLGWTECECLACFISLPGSLINHVSSHDKQHVSGTALLIFQEVSSILPHPMTNSKWVILLHFFAKAVASVWLCDQQEVSDITLFLCQAVASIKCPTLWPTGSEWHCFISFPDSLINHVSSHDQQFVSDIGLFFYQEVSSSHDQQLVSDTALFLCQAVSSILNRK